MAQHHYIACDLGAESGRVMLGTLGDNLLTLEEIHRFPNEYARVFGSMRWDVLRMFEELKKGIKMIADRDIPARGLSVDSWGVDYVLVRGTQPMLTAPVCYRDERNESAFKKTIERVPQKEIFAATGLQFMPFNTVFQLVAEAESNAEILALADRFLLIGDYFNWLFSGRMVAERSLASTTQLYDPRRHAWADDLLRRLKFPPSIFPEIVPSGTPLGTLREEITTETGLRDAQVIATCSHDTGAAVAAVPAKPGDHWAYLSSGTWSLIGVELDAPRIDETVRAHNFTNEVGYGGSIRFLKNIVGLWVVQECRRAWEQEGQAYSYSDLTRLAEEADPLRSLINPGAERFLKPGDMPEKIRSYCRETDQPEPESPGQHIRCALESLALIYRRSLTTLEALTGRTLTELYIVGGGSKNQLLNQFAADATGREVIAGPAEATAIGNILIQALALGQLGSLEELRATVRKSVPLQRHHPGHPEAWAHAAKRFEALDVLT